METVNVDLAMPSGVEQLCDALRGRTVDSLLANAGLGLGKGFLDQSFEDIPHVINTNVIGTLYLIQKVGRDMRARGAGRILITGSIAGFMPGSFQAVYNGQCSWGVFTHPRPIADFRTKVKARPAFRESQ